MSGSIYPTPMPASARDTPASDINYFNFPVHSFRSPQPVATPTLDSHGFQPLDDARTPLPLTGDFTAADGVWFPEGYWAERHLMRSVARKSTSSSRFWKWRSRSTKSTSETEPPEASYGSGRLSASPPSQWQDACSEPPTQRQTSPYVSESAHVLSLQRPPVDIRLLSLGGGQSSPNSPESVDKLSSRSSPGESVVKATVHPVSVDSSPRLSARRLYLEAMKEIKAKMKVRVGKEERFCETILEDTTDAHSHATMDGSRSFVGTQTLGKVRTSSKDDSNSLKISRKLFGKAPWRRKESVESFSSVSSSIRDILSGHTPPVTPVSEVKALSFTNSPTSQYPGGEATRVNTPPLDEDTADGKPRGFFTSSLPPSSDSTKNNFGLLPMKTNLRYSLHRRSLSTQPREWWEHVPSRPVHRDPVVSAKGFEFDIPEHLPSSPLCPANVKHYSGGTGLCVYHGRRRAKSMLRDEAILGDSTFCE
ncbi:hypothetical protein HJFPF1_06273 [Paramyrothecium foliicola]|nr:hypothetical protein HJFPF1_06273 [Paramyrothecium foliicola]